MINKGKLYHYTIDLLNKLVIKYESELFPSGAIMIHIWKNKDFYVLQLENDLVGVSKIDDENPGFSTVPDEKFYDDEKFKGRLMQILDIKRDQ